MYDGPVSPETRAPAATTVSDVPGTNGSKPRLTAEAAAALCRELEVEADLVKTYADRRTASIAKRNHLMWRLYLEAGMTQVAIAGHAHMSKGLAQQVLRSPEEQARMNRKRGERATRARAKAKAVPVKGSKRL